MIKIHYCYYNRPNGRVIVKKNGATGLNVGHDYDKAYILFVQGVQIGHNC